MKDSRGIYSNDEEGHAARAVARAVARGKKGEVPCLNPPWGWDMGQGGGNTVRHLGRGPCPKPYGAYGRPAAAQWEDSTDTCTARSLLHRSYLT